MAYHITRKWSKQKILRNYLNSIYFGNGAYGIESAARTYFGSQHPGCETDRGAALRRPARAAGGRADRRRRRLAERLSTRSPTRSPPRSAATSCSHRMLEQRLIAREQYDAAIAEPIPPRRDIQPPREETKYPYFTSWIKQQVVDQLGGGQTGARQAFEGGLTDPDHDRRALPEGGRRRDPRLAALHRRPARLAGGDRQQDRRGPRDGRRRRLQHLAVQPRHPGPAPAGLGVQAVRARRGAQARHLPHLAVVVAQEGLRRPRLVARSSRSRTTATPTRA